MKFLRNYFYKKIFLVLTINFLFFSSNFALNIIFDFAALVNNCCSKKMTLFLNPIKQGEFTKFRQNFICQNSEETDPVKVLMDLCTELSLKLWGHSGDIVKRFYIGELRSEDISEFIVAAEAFMSKEIQAHKSLDIEMQTLLRLKDVFFGTNKTSICRTSRRVSQLYFSDCFEQDSTGFCILDFVSRYNHNKLYLIGDGSNKWLKLYKDKFNNIFKYFIEKNIRFSFQSKFVVEEMDFFIDFLNTYKVNGDECLLITNNADSLRWAKMLSIKSINIDSIKKVEFIETLLRFGAIVI